jgi:molybdate transport system regulatory protein
MPTRRRPRPATLEVHGHLWLSVGADNLGGRGRIGLLRAVAEHGSITHAARAIGLSYKAAWDALDAMDHVAGEPLVERSKGGRGGGSTRLTPRGQRLVERFAQIEAVHQRFVQLLSAQAGDLAQELDTLRLFNMRTSARNQFVGRVSQVRAGAVNDEVELTLANGARIVATVTRESTEALALRTGQRVFALVKASAVLLAAGEAPLRVSARNQLPGTVAEIHPGAVNAEVVVEIAGGLRVAAIVTRASVAALELAPGRPAVALFDASSVILGTDA